MVFDEVRELRAYEVVRMSWGDDPGVARLPGGPSAPDRPATSRESDGILIGMPVRFDDLANCIVEFKGRFQRRFVLTVTCVNIALFAVVIATLEFAQGNS